MPMDRKEYRQFQGWFRKLNERFTDTNRRIENRYTALLNVCTNTRVMVDRLKEELREIRAELARHGQELARHGQVLEAHGRQLTEQREETEGLRRDVSEIRREVGEIRASLVGRDQFFKYEARLTAVELAVKELDRRAHL